MSIQERLAAFRKVMADANVTYYLVPTADYHMSEYVNPHFGARRYLSGFTGSAGTLLVGKDEAYLWTDGRYFIQAENQLANSTITLMKMGEAGVDTLEEFLSDHLKANDVLGVDGRVITVSQGEYFEKLCGEKQAIFNHELDLINEIWHDRPALPSGELYVLSDKYTGKSLKDKVSALVNSFNNVDVYVDSALDNIAWLTNLRGNDVMCNPIFLSYIMVNNGKLTLYIDDLKINDEVRTYLTNNDVDIKSYNQIYDDLKAIKNANVQIDKRKNNYALCKAIDDTSKIISVNSYIELAKAMKNETEVECLRKSHLKDGIAVTKFMYWLKKNVGTMSISEISASEYLTNLRSMQEGYISPSFGTIAGYKEHAAMMHYFATKESNYNLEAEGMFLVDSGGQYYDGTTDITRTYALGAVSEEMKRDYTLVLKGMIDLSKQRFLYGCSGINLDILARGALWNHLIDYKCGTGHGVGFVLGVHEGPHGIRWKRTLAQSELAQLEEGMVVTNEPGVYKEGEYGIRIENELVVCKDIVNEYGQFMKFETITYAPIDIDLVVADMLDESERTFLNEYHARVYELISPALNDEEKKFLKEYTRAI